MAVLVIGSKNYLLGTNDGQCAILGSNSTTCSVFLSLPSELCLNILLCLDDRHVAFWTAIAVHVLLCQVCQSGYINDTSPTYP
jgi:hypothetical protein